MTLSLHNNPVRYARALVFSLVVPVNKYLVNVRGGTRGYHYQYLPCTGTCHFNYFQARTFLSRGESRVYYVCKIEKGPGGLQAFLFISMYFLFFVLFNKNYRFFRKTFFKKNDVPPLSPFSLPSFSTHKAHNPPPLPALSPQPSIQSKSPRIAARVCGAGAKKETKGSSTRGLLSPPFYFPCYFWACVILVGGGGGK